MTTLILRQQDHPDVAHIIAVQQGHRLFYVSSEDILTIYAQPTFPVFAARPYPFFIGLLFDPTRPTDTHSFEGTVVGFSLKHVARIIRSHPDRWLHRLIGKESISLNMLLQYYERKIRSWYGWDIRWNPGFQKECKFLKTKGDMQTFLNMHKTSTEDLFAMMRQYVEQEMLPTQIPTSIFHRDT